MTNNKIAPIEKIDSDAYRKSEFFERNQDIWRLRFVEEWSILKISKHFSLEISEVKKIIDIHRAFYKQEYD